MARKMGGGGKGHPVHVPRRASGGSFESDNSKGKAASGTPGLPSSGVTYPLVHDGSTEQGMRPSQTTR